MLLNKGGFFFLPAMSVASCWLRVCRLTGCAHVVLLVASRLCRLIGCEYVVLLVAHMSSYWLRVCRLIGCAHVVLLVASMSSYWLRTCRLTGCEYVVLLVAHMSSYQLRVCRLTGCEYVVLLVAHMSSYWLRVIIATSPFVMFNYDVVITKCIDLQFIIFSDIFQNKLKSIIMLLTKAASSSCLIYWLRVIIGLHKCIGVNIVLYLVTMQCSPQPWGQAYWH